MSLTEEQFAGWLLCAAITLNMKFYFNSLLWVPISCYDFEMHIKKGQHKGTLISASTICKI